MITFSRAAILGLALSSSPLALAADTFELDGVHSFVGFGVTHLKVSRFYGRFNDVSGKFVLDQDPAKSSVEITVKAGSVDTGNKKRDQHLMSPDFFAAEEFPEISFKSKSVKKAEKGFEVAGTLTLHGVSKDITITVEHVGTGPGPKGETRSGFETSFTIKRSEYGVNYGLPDAVSDEVRMHVSLEGVKK